MVPHQIFTNKIVGNNYIGSLGITFRHEPDILSLFLVSLIHDYDLSITNMLGSIYSRQDLLPRRTHEAHT